MVMTSDLDRSVTSVGDLKSDGRSVLVQDNVAHCCENLARYHVNPLFLSAIWSDEIRQGSPGVRRMMSNPGSEGIGLPHVSMSEGRETNAPFKAIQITINRIMGSSGLHEKSRLQHVTHVGCERRIRKDCALQS